MASIREVSLFSYRSYRGRRDWSQAELGVLRFVRAIKCRPVSAIGGPAPLRVKGKTHQIGSANPDDAFEWFGELAHDVLVAELGTTRVVLVPVPNSDCTRSQTPARTARLAEAVAMRGEAAVHDLLRWKRGVPSASQGGGDRRPENLYPELRVVPGFAPMDRPYVLIDDVSTTGGHIRACAARLEQWSGVDVPLAIAGAQTATEPVDDMYAQRQREHPRYVP